MKTKPTNRLAFPLASSIAALLAGSHAQAATYYWDNNGTTAGFGNAAGTWAAPTVNQWSTGTGSTAGTATPGASITTATADPVNFGNGALGLGAGSIAVSGTVSSQNMTFASGSGAIVLSGGTITFAAASTITTNNTTNTISSIIGGAATSITKTGAGTLLLNGSAANTFVGGLILNAGSVALDFANMATPTDLLASGKALTFSNGASFTLKGKSSGATAQTMGNVTVNAGGGNLLIDPSGGTSTTLTLGLLNNPTAAGSSLTLGTALGAGSGAVDLTTTSNKNLLDTYGGRIVFANGTAATGYDWATTASVASPYTLSAYSSYTAMATSGIDTLNSRISASDTLIGALTTDTLKIENPAASQSLSLDVNTLTLTGGGLLVTGTNATAVTGTAGNLLTAGNGSGSYDLIVHQFNSGGLDIGAVIGNNGANATALTKAGTGALTLSGANTFTGGLFVNAGEVVIGNPGALNITTPNTSENAVTLGAGTLSLNGNSVVLRSLTSSNPASVVRNANATPATLTVGNSGNAASTYVGSIQDGSGGGALTLAKSGTGVLNLSGGTNTFTGGIVMNAGTLTFNADTNLGAVGASNGITLNSSATFSTSATFARNISIASGANLTMDGGNSTNSGDLSGDGGVVISSGFGSQHFFTGTNNTFKGAVNIGLVSGTGGQAYRAQFTSFADSVTANGRIIFSAKIATHAEGSVFEYIGAAPLLLANRQFEIASPTLVPTNGHQIRANGVTTSDTVTVNTDLVVSSPYAQTLAFRGANTGANTFAGIIGDNPSAAVGTTPLAAGFTTTPTTTITLASVQGITVGAAISGTGIAGGTTISAINPSTRVVTLSAATNGTAGSAAQIMTVTGVTNPVSLIKADAGTWALTNAANSFTGSITFNNTTTSAGTLSYVSAAGTNPINFNATTGFGSTLSYTGASPLTMSGLISATALTTGGITLEANGTSPTATINYSNAASFSTSGGGAAVRYIGLGGSNTGDNIFAGAINNGAVVGGNTQLAKTGAGKWVLTGAGNFTGGLFVNNGTVSVNSIPDGGVSSPLGANTRINLGRDNNDGILIYTGAGNLTNRDTRLGGPSAASGTGGSSILNDGSGALTFTAATFNISQTGIAFTRTLTLGGSYTSTANEIQGVIQDNTATTGLVNLTKTGAGTWKLSGANTYTGNTTVNAGTLELADNAQLKFVLGATSGANNSISGAGTVTLEGDFVIDTTAADALSSGSWTLENVTSLPGAYGTNFTVVGFTDAGSNTWTKDLSPTKKYTFDETTGILTLVSTGTTYASWINGFFPSETDPLIIGAGADPDNDGISNGVEMVLGGDPKLGMDTALMPTIELVTDPVSVPAIPAGNYLLFTYRRSDLSVGGGVTADCETDTDLVAPWTAATGAPGVVIQVDDNFTFTPPAAADTDRVRVYVPRGANTKLFGRLNVVVP